MHASPFKWYERPPDQHRLASYLLGKMGRPAASLEVLGLRLIHVVSGAEDDLGGSSGIPAGEG